MRNQPLSQVQYTMAKWEIIIHLDDTEPNQAQLLSSVRNNVSRFDNITINKLPP